MPRFIRCFRHLTLSTPRSSGTLEQMQDNLDLVSTHVPAKRSGRRAPFNVWKAHTITRRRPIADATFGFVAHDYFFFKFYQAPLPCLWMIQSLCSFFLPCTIAWVCPSRDTSLRKSVSSSRRIPYTWIWRGSLTCHAVSVAGGAPAC